LSSQAFDLDVALTVLDEHSGFADGLVIQPEFQAGEVEGIETHFKGAANEASIYPIGVALQFEAAILAHLAGLTPAEGLDELVVMSGAHVLQILLVAFQGTLAGFTAQSSAGSQLFQFQLAILLHTWAKFGYNGGSR